MVPLEQLLFERSAVRNENTTSATQETVRVKRVGTGPVPALLRARIGLNGVTCISSFAVFDEGVPLLNAADKFNNGLRGISKCCLVYSSYSYYSTRYE